MKNIKEIEIGQSIINIHTNSKYEILDISDSTILLINKHKFKILIYWSDLLENFRYEH
jgi:hypothetical protein